LLFIEFLCSRAPHRVETEDEKNKTTTRTKKKTTKETKRKQKIAE